MTIKDLIERREATRIRLRKFRENQKSRETPEERNQRLHKAWQRKQELYDWPTEEKKKILEMKREVKEINDERIECLLTIAPNEKVVDNLAFIPQTSTSIVSNKESYRKRRQEIYSQEKSVVFKKIGKFFLYLIINFFSRKKTMQNPRRV